MKVELLYFDGCPGYEKARRALEKALAQENARVRIESILVDTDEEAGRSKFPGSPTIRVDGRDLFPVEERGVWRLGCRVYRTPEDLKDHPTAEMIRARLPEGRPKRCPGWLATGDS